MRHSQLEEDARKLKDIISKFSNLRVDHTEYACLKALVLFKAGQRGFKFNKIFQKQFFEDILEKQTEYNYRKEVRKRDKEPV